MNKRMKANRIKKNDYSRVLVTETLPYETPIIFSNDGLYERVVGIETSDQIQKALIRALVFGENEPENIHSCIPYLYKIRKNSTEFRRLGLLHPRSQWKVKEFYEKYEDLILYHCSQSAASIRSPEKVAGSFFFKSVNENLNQYKSGSVSLLSLDQVTKHSPSFFSYRGFDRLYKFFESRDYYLLEKRFAFSLTLDVSKCFDSIYTHTLSWAVKDKEFTKTNVGNKATFAQEFDAVMMHSNHNETNGIVIGPEVSRIFAEILFQEIDCRVILRLSSKPNYIFGQDYLFRRYVDDVFIFAKSEEAARTVYKIYADVLSSFNLHANSAKSIGMARPFVTNKSRLIHAANLEVNRFIEKFLDANADGTVLSPRLVHSRWRLTRSFIEAIKTICSHNQVNYDEVASYLIAVLTERVKKIVSISTISTPDAAELLYRDSLLVLLDVLYFLYAVSPSVSASYKLCTSVILIIRFTRQHLPRLENTIAHAIYDLTQMLLSEHDASNPDGIDGLLPLEVLNVILAAKELGPNYLIPEDTVSTLFADGPAYSYFSIVSCLFYIQDEPGYDRLRNSMLAAAEEKLSDLKDIRMNSEKAYLLLDLLTCPYIPDKRKKVWIRNAFAALAIPKPTNAQLAPFLLSANNSHIQINWKEVDLLSSLEKKELKQAY